MNQAITAFIEQNNYPTFDLQAVFFDMDGVLFDSMPFHAAAWTRVMQEHQFDFTEYDAYMNEGRTGNSTIDEFYIRKYGHSSTEEQRQAIYAIKSSYFANYPEPKIIPDINAFLEIVKMQALGRYVVTGSAQASLFNNLEKHFPGMFSKEKMVTAFDVKYGKPNPEPYLIALNKAHLEPWQAIVIENAPLGVRSAVDAGIFTIAVNTGILKDDELWQQGAHLVVPNVQSLIDIWQVAPLLELDKD